jgi:hypothetical protein
MKSQILASLLLLSLSTSAFALLECQPQPLLGELKDSAASEHFNAPLAGRMLQGSLQLASGAERALHERSPFMDDLSPAQNRTA